MRPSVVDNPVFGVTQYSTGSDRDAPDIERVPVLIPHADEIRSEKERKRYAKPAVGEFAFLKFENDTVSEFYETEEEALAAAKEAFVYYGGDKDVYMLVKIAKKVRLFRETKAENI